MPFEASLYSQQQGVTCHLSLLTEFICVDVNASLALLTLVIQLASTHIVCGNEVMTGG